MPELPEVEVARQGIAPYVLHQAITDVIVRHPRLRFAIPTHLKTTLTGQQIQTVTRRGKYLLFTLPSGTLIWHLGMSGSLRILTAPSPPRKHDHVDLVFKNHHVLRFNDPRRFGALLWTAEDPLQHPLLGNLGPEPLSKAFSARYLANQAKNKKIVIKSFIMNSKIVVGVGNIYATEALFAAKIHPLTPVKQVKPAQWDRLCREIKNILRKAIRQGGTTLKDFVQSDGKPGYFKQKLKVYGRTGEACVRCGQVLEQLRIAQRRTVFCGRCQTRFTGKNYSKEIRS